VQVAFSNRDYFVAKTIHRSEYRQLIDLLRERRESMGISQATLASALGWTQQKVSYVETGARRMDVLEYILLAKALGISPLSAFRRAEKMVLAKPSR
jgi:transcriptional regulator with XRE-family HTH domain